MVTIKIIQGNMPKSDWIELAYELGHFIAEFCKRHSSEQPEVVVE